MLDTLFANDIAVSLLTGDNVGLLQIHHEEEAIASSWTAEKRANEFRLGRFACRKAMDKLGIDLVSTQCPVLRGEHNEPLWPGGVAGSIAHSNDTVVAAVGRNETYASIGVDLEYLNRKIRQPISRLICTEEEKAWVDAPDHTRLLMLFTAKECIYKAFFPLVKEYISFQDASLQWDEACRGFHFSFTRPLGGRKLDVSLLLIRCICTDGLVISGLSVPQAN